MFEKVKEAIMWRANGSQVSDYRHFENGESGYVSDIAVLAMLGISEDIPGCGVTTITYADHQAAVYIVNNTFLKLPLDIQKAGLAHEEGHVSLNHLSKARWYTTILRFFHEPEYEYEADAYAVKKVGKLPMIDLLNIYKEINCRGIDKRIERIRKMS